MPTATGGRAVCRRRDAAALVLVWLAAWPLAWWAVRAGAPTVPAAAAAWVWLLVVAPVVEESVWRPCLQQGLARWWAPRCGPRRAALLAAAVVTAVFVLAHAGRASGAWALAWALPGAVLAEVWRRGQTLWTCIATHALFNAALIAASLP